MDSPQKDQPHEEPSPLESARHQQRRSSCDEHDPTKQAKTIAFLREKVSDLEAQLAQTTNQLERARERIETNQALAAEKIKVVNAEAATKVGAAEQMIKTVEEKIKTVEAKAALKIVDAKAELRATADRRVRAERNLASVRRENAKLKKDAKKALVRAEKEKADLRARAEAAERNLSQMIAVNDKWSMLGLRCCGVFGKVKSEMRKRKLVERPTGLKVLAPVKLGGAADAIVFETADTEEKLSERIKELGGELVKDTEPIWVTEDEATTLEYDLEKMGDALDKGSVGADAVCWVRSRNASMFPFDDGEETPTGERVQIYPCLCPTNDDIVMMMNALSLHMRDSMMNFDDNYNRGS